jgi:phospholipase/carboxylesterase
MQTSVSELSVRLPVSYELDAQAEAERGVLVLHGYADHARSARRRLLGRDPLPGFTVLAPNALFPAPVPKLDEFREAYAWYFRDPKSGSIMISPDLAAEALARLLAELGLAGLDWILLGFSQGGFFAPHLVRAGVRARTIISVGAAYRRDAYEGLPPLRVHAIHGTSDEIVTPERARSSFEEIRGLGYGATFHALEGVGHTLDDAGRALVRRLIAEETRD